VNRWFSAGLLLFAYTSASAQSGSTTKGTQSPIISGNGNIAIAINGNGNKVVLERAIPKTKPPTRRTLESAAKAYPGNGIEWAGVFTPAHDASPVTRCKIPSNSTTVYVGHGALTVSCIVFKEHLHEHLTPQSSGGTCNIFSDVPAPSSADPVPLLSVVRTGTNLTIDGRLLGPNGELRAFFRNGGIYINKDAISLAERPDSSTLSLLDKSAKKVLEVRYSSPNTVLIDGSLYFQSGRSLNAERGYGTLADPGNNPLRSTSDLGMISGGCWRNITDYSFGLTM
jgi:hypothetical protein